MGRRSLARPQEGPPEGEAVDTSEELRQRRSLVRSSVSAIPDNVLRRLSSIGSVGSTSSAPPCSPNMFFNCLKLAAQNKITPKNAFSLSMIDYMSVAVRSEKSLITNFQIASCSLDACVKIYSARVDHVAGNVAECVMTLSMMNKKGGIPTEEGETGADVEDEDQPKKQKKKTKSKASVLAADPSDLVLDMTKSTPKNKMFSLVGNLMDESLDSITFKDRSRNGAVPGMTRAELETAPGGDTKVMVKWPVLKKGASICPSFSDFRFTREKDVGGSVMRRKSSSRKSLQSQRVTFTSQDDADLDFEDAPFEDDFAGGTITEEVAACAAAPRAALHLHNVPDSVGKDSNAPFTAKMPAMFCFDQENKMPQLHGPAYWRYKKPKTLNGAAPVKRRITVPPAPIDFKKLIDLSKLRKSKAKTYLSRDTLVRWNPERLMMPFETELEGKSMGEEEQSILEVGLCNPLRIPDPRTTKGSHTDKTPLRFSYNYNNAADKQDYCPFPEQPILASDDDEDDYASGTENLVEDGEALNNLFNLSGDAANTSLIFGEKSLVPLPQNLVQTVAPTWKTVKGINMRHIEANLWKGIEETGGETEDEKLAARWRFSKLRQELPLKTQENASVATTLYALLNVANKKGLELTGNPHHSDLQVRRLRTKPKEKEARVHPALLGYDVDD